MRLKSTLDTLFYDHNINSSIYNFRPCEIDKRYLNVYSKKIIFRSSLIDDYHLSKSQKQLLLEKYQIKTILDLRTREEHIHTKFDSKGFETYHIPLDTYNFDIFKKIRLSVAEYYNYLTTVYSKNLRTIKDILSLLKKTQSNIVFHCSAGIDRTGLISALYLKEQGYNHSYLIKDFTYNFYYALRGRLNNNLKRIYNDKSCLTILIQLRNKQIGFSQFIKNYL